MFGSTLSDGKMGLSAAVGVLVGLILVGGLCAQTSVPPIIDPSNLTELTYAPPGAFVSPQPLLQQGTPPVTWSLENHPPGMTIDPATGVFSWIYPDPEESDLFVTLIATNSVGMDMVEVFIEKLSSAILPVNPIEERSIFIGAGTTTSQGQTRTASIATLTPPPGSDYSGIVLQFPGYTEVSESDPNRTRVTLRSAGLYERAGQGGQNFPMQSGAVFVVETHDATGAPFSFTDPVHVSIPFVHREDPLYTDIVDFNWDLGAAIDMRICRDLHMGPGTDFVFIDRLQLVEPAAGMVHVEGVTPLTDTEGSGIWGTVVNTHVPTAPEIVNHLLGSQPITGPDHPIADRNGDSTIDAADLVTRLED